MEFRGVSGIVIRLQASGYIFYFTFIELGLLVKETQLILVCFYLFLSLSSISPPPPLSSSAAAGKLMALFALAVASE